MPLRIASLPKAELHLHLEGSIRPAVACALSARHGVALTEDEVRRRYDYRNFTEFIEAFKWVTSFLREPHDFALLAADLAEQLLEQHVVYAEVTLSVGIMFLRKQDPQANFEAILAATEPFEKRGLRLNWIFDAVRQFGPELALDVVEAARRCASPRIVAFGIGGDELSVPTREFKHVYARAKSCGLHLLIHAGEIGGPEKIREAVEILGRRAHRPRHRRHPRSSTHGPPRGAPHSLGGLSHQQSAHRRARPAITQSRRNAPAAPPAATPPPRHSHSAFYRRSRNVSCFT